MAQTVPLAIRYPAEEDTGNCSDLLSSFFLVVVMVLVLLLLLQATGDGYGSVSVRA